jgi:general secretion pathway protein H
MAQKVAKAKTQMLSPGEDQTAGARGFTLLELVIVMVLLAMVTAVVGISLTGGMTGIELETSTRNVIALMRYTRSEAIGKQQVFRVVIGEQDQAPSGRYFMTNDFGERIKEVNLPEGIVFAAPEGRQLPLVVSFYPNGRSSGGVFAVKSPGGRQLLIAADPITGLSKMVRAQEER